MKPRTFQEAEERFKAAAEIVVRALAAEHGFIAARQMVLELNDAQHDLDCFQTMPAQREAFRRSLM